MKKRFLLLTILALLANFANAQSTQAMTTDGEGTQWWDVDELIQIEKEMDQILKEYCGDDTWCKLNQSPEIINSSSKYTAASVLYGMTMMITDINPAKNTIKVFYNGRDSIMRWEDIPAYDIDDLKITYMSSDFSEQYKIFGYSDSDEHIDIQNDAETELNLYSSFNFSDDTIKILGYSIVAEPLRSEGSISYSGCTGSAEYEYGMGCRVMISNDSRIKFTPYRVAEKDIVEKAEDVKIDSIEETDQPAQDGDNMTTNDWQLSKSTEQLEVFEPSLVIASTEVITSSNNNTKETGGGTNDYADGLSESPQKTESDETSSGHLNTESETNEIEIPNSGNINKKEDIFPWWILILILGCVAILIWLFWPKHEKDSKKS